MSTEYQIVLSGIGGQGVKLSSRIIATAAISESMNVLQLATYTGAMRGGQSSVDLILSRSRIASPPVLTSAGIGVIYHTNHAADHTRLIRPTGLAIIDARLVEAGLVAHVEHVVPVDVGEIAALADSPASTSMVMVGVFTKVTRLVGLGSVLLAMREILPPYRRDRAGENEVAIRAGYDAVETAAFDTEAVTGP